MVRAAKRFLQSTLKLVNTIIGMLGIVMILYSLWMIRVWQRDMEGFSVDNYCSTFPWFIHAFIGMGIILCAITCLGHIAAETANVCCLSCYMVIIFMMLLLETAIIADVVLNSDWEKDLPEDPTGKFDDFKDFVKSNFDICKWIGLSIILIEGFSVLLATILRTLGPDYVINYDSDDNYAPSGLPLLNPHDQTLPYVVGDPNFTFTNEAWKKYISLAVRQTSEQSGNRCYQLPVWHRQHESPKCELKIKMKMKMHRMYRSRIRREENITEFHIG